MNAWAARAAHAANWLVKFISGHWLAMLNALVAVTLGLAFLAPWLMLRGHTGAAQLLYRAYMPLCHQLPERSFFLGGPYPSYSYGELVSRVGHDVPLRYIGEAQVGYKVAFCERDTAIYVGWLLAGLLFALCRRRLPRLSWKAVLILGLASTVPMAVDGGLQLVGVLDSTWLRRAITGLLFGSAIIWLLPWLDWGMRDAHEVAGHTLEGMSAHRR